MKEFNENPFKADTPVSIFSNGTEAECWMNENCDKCIKHSQEELGHCEIEDAIAEGWIGNGTIPLHIAKRMGVEYNPLYQSARPYKHCSEFDNGKMPF